MLHKSFNERKSSLQPIDRSARLKASTPSQVSKRTAFKNLGCFSTRSKLNDIAKKRLLNARRGAVSKKGNDKTEMTSPVSDLFQESHRLHPHLHHHHHRHQFDPSTIYLSNGLITHYTISKYIEELPDEWTNINTNSNDDEEAEDLSYANNSNNNNNNNNKLVDLGSSGSGNISSSDKESLKRAINLQSNNNNNNDSNASNSDSDKSKSSQEDKPKKFKANDFTKKYFEFLLNKNDPENIIKKKSKTPEEEGDVAAKKGLSTISSKSHSKIVLFNEENEESEEEIEEEENLAEFKGQDDAAKDVNKSHSNDSGSNSNSNNEKNNATSSNEGLSSNSTTLNSSLNKENHCFSKFTEEALAKHTIQQNEIFTQNLLMKILHPTTKYYSGK